MSNHTMKEFVSKKSLGGIVVHKDSKLVVRSAKDHVVIGRVEDEVYIQGVDAVVVQLCEEYNFKYDESLIIAEEPQDGAAEEVTEDTAEVQEEVQEEPVEEAQEEAEETEEPVEDVKSEVEQTEVVGGKEIEQVSLPVSSCSVSSSTDLSKILSEFQAKIQAVLSSKDLAFEKLRKEKEESEKLNSKKLEELTSELNTTKTKMKKLLAAMQESV